jgi:hypothetical protein
MVLRLLPFLLLVSLLAACGGPAGPGGATLARCDDGGDGGVLIDGVCF